LTTTATTTTTTTIHNNYLNNGDDNIDNDIDNSHNNNSNVNNGHYNNMFQADCDADFQDWTEAMSVLIQKIELKTGLKVQDLELDKDGKTYRTPSILNSLFTTWWLFTSGLNYS